MQKRRGFTLIDVMIVILIITVILAIAMPQMMTARATSQRRVCQNNIRIFDTVKSQYAMAENIPAGTGVSMADLVPYLKNTPVCPGGGTYDLRTVDLPTLCSIPEHNLAP